jgi:hypothetical protein
MLHTPQKVIFFLSFLYQNTFILEGHLLFCTSNQMDHVAGLSNDHVFCAEETTQSKHNETLGNG